MLPRTEPDAAAAGGFVDRLRSLDRVAQEHRPRGLHADHAPVAQPDPEGRRDDLAAQLGPARVSLGPMVDWFPSATGGFHVGGGVGWGTLNAVNYTSTGTAFHLFAGYDVWIGNEWSLGPALRLTSSKTSKTPYEDAATSIVLMISVLDH